MFTSSSQAAFTLHVRWTDGKVSSGTFLLGSKGCGLGQAQLVFPERKGLPFFDKNC